MTRLEIYFLTLKKLDKIMDSNIVIESTISENLITLKLTETFIDNATKVYNHIMSMKNRIGVLNFEYRLFDNQHILSIPKNGNWE